MAKNAKISGRDCVLAFLRKLVVCLTLSVLSLSSFADNPVTGSGTECVYSTLNTYTGPSTIKANWDPNTINLYWYNDDQKLTVQTAANTCNYDSGIALPSTNPTKTGYTFSGWEVLGGVPAGYTQLEYLESTGTQYIDTGLQVYSNTTAEFSYMFTATGTNYVFGQVAGSAGSILGYRSNRIWWFTPNDRSLSDTQRHRVEFRSDGNVYRDDVAIGVRGTFGTQQTLTILVFAERNDNNAINKGKVKIYYFRLKNGDNVVQNLIPVKRDTDSVLGMYDTVSGTFFTNAGSGTFTAGPAVQ